MGHLRKFGLRRRGHTAGSHHKAHQSTTAARGPRDRRRAATRACSAALVTSLVAGLLGAAPPASTGQEVGPDESGGTAEAAQADDARQVTQREAIEVVRYAGRDRTETAASIASDRTASGPGFGDDTVLLARADVLPDSLAGGFLAGVQQAPILLTDSQTLSPQAAQYLQREQPDNVVILGGTNAISPGIAAELEADHRVLRVGGANRIETAAEIARYATPDQPQGLALLATAGEFPDALTASAVAAGENVPLLLTGGSELAQPTAEALDELAIDEVVIAGGPAAVGEGVRSAVFVQDLRVIDTDAECVGGIAPGGLELTPVNS